MEELQQEQEQEQEQPKYKFFCNRCGKNIPKGRICNKCKRTRKKAYQKEYYKGYYQRKKAELKQIREELARYKKQVEASKNAD